MRVLVTGGAGFIGSHVVDALVERGDDVRVIDLLHPGAHGGRPEYLRGDVEYLWGDVADATMMERAVEGIDAVSHQAAMVGLGVDFDDVRAYCAHNDLGTASLLEALHRSGFAGRLVLASSMVVYGEGRYECPQHDQVRPLPRTVASLQAGEWEPRCVRCGSELEASAVPEDAPTDPRNVYAATKLHQEHLCAAFAREHPGSVVTALRYHNVYGPRMPRATPYAGVAAIFRSAVEAGHAPEVTEDGGQRRDFVHVEDVARANELALHADEPAPGPLNIASGTPHSVLEMAAALCSGFDPSAPRPVVTGRFRLGDVRHVFASTERAASMLGFRAAIGFDEGMRDFARAQLRGAPDSSGAVMRSSGRSPGS